MPANKRLLVLPGDGIGPEVMREVKRVVDWMARRRAIRFDIGEDLVGGASIDTHGVPITPAVVQAAREADAVLFGSVGGPQWDKEPFTNRPELAILTLRRELGLFANLRPATVLEPLVNASTLKPDVVRGLDLMIVRESTGGIYFGEPRGVEDLPGGGKRGFNTESYDTHEIERVARVAFELAGKRQGRLCSVEKANVMESGLLWRQTVHGAGRARVPRRQALAHVRGQLRHAARARSPAVRRDRHRQPVRRPAERPRLHAAPAAWACCPPPRWVPPSRASRAPRCTSRSTAARRTSPARAWPTRSRRS